MPNFNQIIIAGHLGKDAEVKYLQDGKPVTRFSVAYSDKFSKDKKTTWYECSAFGDRFKKLADMGALGKGKAVQVVGRHSSRDWTSQSGKSGHSNEIMVNDVVLLGAKDDGHAEPRPDPNSASAGTDYTGSDENVPF